MSDSVGCEKQRFESSAAAKKSMRRLIRRRKGRKGTGRPQAYLCAACHHWHWGHSDKL